MLLTALEQRAPRSYDDCQHHRWRAGQASLPPVPANPDTLRVWVDVEGTLGAALTERVRRVIGETDWTLRPWTEVRTCDLSPGSVYVKSDPIAMALGCRLEAAVSAAAGHPMYLSVTGIKLHRLGDPTIRHRDQFPHNSHLLTWTTHLTGADSWPLYVERPGMGVDRYETLSGPRALLFAARDCWHWRDPFPGDLGISVHMRYCRDPDLVPWQRSEIETLADIGDAMLAGQSSDTGGVTEVIRGARRRTRAAQAAATPPYQVVRQVVSRAEIDAIQDAVTDVPERRATTLERSGQSVIDLARRRCTTQRLDVRRVPWLFERLSILAAKCAPTVHPGVAAAARDGLVGDPNVLTYRPGDFHDLHRDASIRATTHRRTSMVLVLEAAEVGGGLEMMHDDALDLAPGDAVAWAAARNWHRVSVVRAGRRRTVSAWLGESPL